MAMRFLRPRWPQDGLGSGQETNRSVHCVRNRMSDFKEVGSRWVITRGGTLLSKSHLWMCSEGGYCNKRMRKEEIVDPA